MSTEDADPVVITDETKPPVEGDPPPEVDAEQQALEDRARRMGWRPENEYSGPKGRWVDARTFIERGETELPILRERLRKFDDRLVSTERELTASRAELREARTKINEQSEVLVELRDMSVTAVQQGYNRAMNDLKARERQAVAEANTAVYDQVQEEMRQLEQTRPQPKPRTEPKPTEAAPPTPAAPQVDPTITSWIAQNPWFNADPELQAVATSLHGMLRTQNPNQPLEENLAEVRNRIIQRYPDKFGNESRRRPAAVVSSSAPAPRSRTKTVKDLPADARAALDKFKAQIPNYTDEQYLRLYFGTDYDNS